MTPATKTEWRKLRDLAKRPRDIRQLFADNPDRAKQWALEGRGLLLDSALAALNTRMGQATSYMASVPLSWVVKHVQFAADMPVFAKKVNKTAKQITVDDFTIDHIQQRRPDWRRQMPMAVYLAAWEKHKFPPLLVVGHQKWADDPKSGNWGEDGKAVRESVSADSLGRNLYELAAGDGTVFYALDGQHRLMAMLGLQKLIDAEWLPALDQNGSRKGKSGVNLQDIAQAVQRQGGEELQNAAMTAKLRRIMAEEVGIEIIPAVSKGESSAEAGFRLRSVFVDVNESAKKPTKGESILLDERNGFRVVAREVMVAHTLLKKRVYVKMKNLPETSDDYTTLETLAQVATLHLGYKDEFSEWKIPLIPRDKSSGFIRPKGDGDIGEGLMQMLDYFTELKRLPSHARMVREKNLSASVFRGKKEDNILFRPAAQMAFAEASARLECDHGISLKDAVSELIRQENRGQLKLKDPKAPWCGVIWDSISGKMRANAGAQKLCMRLFVYLLGGKLDEKKLREDFDRARRTYGGDADLPAPWRRP